MRGRRVTVVAALPLLLLPALVAPACSGSVTREPMRASAPAGTAAEEGEILSEDPFESRDAEESAADRMGGTLVALTLVAAVVAAAVLPLLLFL
jgi:hypothetical protein